MLRLHLKRAVLVLPRRGPSVLLVIGDCMVDESFAFAVLMKLAPVFLALFLRVLQVLSPVGRRDVRHFGLLFFGNFVDLFDLGISFRSLLLPPARVGAAGVARAELRVVVHLRDVVVGGPGG